MRNRILIILVLGLAVLNAYAQKQKPNIVFILTDDQRYDAMGFMQHYPFLNQNLLLEKEDDTKINAIRGEMQEIMKSFPTYDFEPDILRMRKINDAKNAIKLKRNSEDTHK